MGRKVQKLGMGRPVGKVLMDQRRDGEALGPGSSGARERGWKQG